MKILLHDGSDLFFLAGDGRLGERVFSSVADFDLTGELEKQIVRKVRGSHARAINRGNVKHRAFFRTRRLLPTPAEAESFAANAERSFPRAGILYFVTGLGTRKLLNTVVKPPAITVQGCEVRLQYACDGGEFTPLVPDLVIDGLLGMKYRMVSNDDGEWFEVGFDSPYLLDGNAAEGWSDPFGQFRLRFQRTDDLASWDYQWEDAPGTPEEDGGTYTYWARSTIPRLWKYVTIDLRMSSDRHAKSITDLYVFGDRLSLPNYPYDMPSEASALQTDLISLGYTGATVTSTSAALSVTAINHTVDGRKNLIITMAGADVTMVKDNAGTNITGPSYPYTMPGQRAALQTALRSAGQTGAVVMLWDDEWEIFIPNLNTIMDDRAFSATITPGDPNPVWNMFGVQQADAPATHIDGEYENLRATTGLGSLEEAPRQFARLAVSPGVNYLY